MRISVRPERAASALPHKALCTLKRLGPALLPAAAALVIAATPARTATTKPVAAIRSGQAIPFSPGVEDVVDAMAVSRLDGYLRDLSGVNAVTVEDTTLAFATRWSLSEPGGLAARYAAELLTGMGFDVRIETFPVGNATGMNVVARLPGAVTPDRVYILGAHLDSISELPRTLAPGAEDNGSGSAGVLTAAAALAGHRFESTIELILFSGEEQLVKGSYAYVKNAVAEGRDVRGVVVFDMISYWKDHYGLLINSEARYGDLMQSAAHAVEAFTDLTWEYSYDDVLSDHVPFMDAGIPALLLADRDFRAYPAYHRSDDTYEKTDPILALKIARAGAAVIAQAAGPVGAAVGVPGSPPAGARLRLSPNPARTAVTATGAAGEPLVIYDLAGRRIRRLPGAAAGAVRWDLTDASGRRVPPGLYWITSGNAAERVVVLP
jgi:hypothetical protein